MSLWLVQSALPGTPPHPGLNCGLHKWHKSSTSLTGVGCQAVDILLHFICITLRSIMRVILSDRFDWLSKPGVAPTAVGISRGSVPVQPGLLPVLPLCISISRHICIPYRMVVRCVAKIHQSASPRPAEKRQSDDCTPYLRRTNHGRKCL